MRYLLLVLGFVLAAFYLEKTLADCSYRNGQNSEPFGLGWKCDIGKGRLILQYDGNLVIYDQNGRARWASGTTNRDVDTMRFQGDGNLVIYARGNRAVWASGTAGNGHYFSFQDDRNLVIYDRHFVALWASGTSD